MLRIDKVEVIEGVTVYGDDALDYVFYPIPEAPRFRVDDKGQPIFKFLKYRMPIDRAEGKKGGGFAFFDTEFTLTPAQHEAVKAALDSRVAAAHPGSAQPKEAQLGTITYLKGTASLLLSEEGGTLIEAVKSAGKPSLFGKNITSFMVEFTPEGATLFEQALQGQGGVVQVVYDLYFTVKLPPLTGRAWFNASKFYSFYQEIDIEWDMWGEDSYRETLRESFSEHETMGIETNFTFALPDADEDTKLKNRIRDMMQSSLEDAVERMMIEDIAPVTEEGRKPPEDIENVTRDLSVSKVASFDMTYQENTAIQWNFVPQGTIPNITTLSDNEGKPIVWSDYASEVDLDDPFFKQLNVTVAVNADFDKLPIHSIETHLEYKQGDEHEVSEFVFAKPDDRGQFRTYIANDSWKYTYWYEVNYVGSSQTFTSEKVETDEQYLTINVDDIGIVAVDVQVGDIDFNQVASAQVTVRYEAPGVQAVEEQFALGVEPDKRSHLFQKLIFKPWTSPYRYRVDYFMKDGRKVTADWMSGSGSPLFVNDPFGATKTVAVRGLGDFTKIGQIFVDLDLRGRRERLQPDDVRHAQLRGEDVPRLVVPGDRLCQRDDHVLGPDPVRGRDGQGDPEDGGRLRDGARRRRDRRPALGEPRPRPARLDAGQAREGLAPLRGHRAPGTGGEGLHLQPGRARGGGVGGGAQGSRPHRVPVACELLPRRRDREGGRLADEHRAQHRPQGARRGSARIAAHGRRHAGHAD